MWPLIILLGVAWLVFRSAADDWQQVEDMHP
jgi:hypothetical protein